MNNRTRLIQHNFNRAAARYLSIAQIQNHAAQKLLHEANFYIKSKSQIILDLGCGPGTFNHLATRPENWIIGLDLSHAMLHKNAVPSAINAQAENLPLANNSIDLVISNLMLQWPANKLQAFCEIHRVLKPGGTLIFTTLVQPSLEQLITSWAQIDTLSHTLQFLVAEDYLNLCQQIGFSLLSQTQWQETIFFENIIELCQHFKSSGTSLPAGQQNGLGGKKALALLNEYYPRQKSGLPLSYHYLMLIARTTSQ